MKSPHQLSCFLYTLLLLLLINFGATAAPRPNIILVMADDMGWGDPSYNSSTVTLADGSPHPDQGWINTPTMDTMAANGIRFDRFYAASAVCSPTRASCLTGRNPGRVGIGGANSGRLGFDETPLSEILAAEGYATGHYGKWHLGTMTTLRKDANRGDVGNTAEYSSPWHHGYDTCFATESKVPTYNPYSGSGPLITDFSDPNFYGTYYWKMPDTWNETSGEGNIVPITEVNDSTNGDDSKLLVDQAIPFMQDAVANNQPFFLVMWFHTPHKPIIDPDGVSETNSSDAAHDSIRDMDIAIGRIRDELTSLGVRGNTMFWVTSDNGPENGVDSFNETEKGRSMRAGRFRGRKGSMYDGGIIVPGILEWPDVVTTPHATDFVAVTSDYYPTILDYLELSVPNQKPLDGVSLRPAIEGTVSERQKPIGFKLGNDYAWRSQQYKLIEQDWKDDNGVSYREIELYDMVNIAPGDESEQTPLATASNVASKPQEIQDLYNQMRSEYSAWISSVGSDNPYIYPTQPTVVLSTPQSSVNGAFTVTATFSENVSQLNASEFVVSNGTASALAGSGTTWSVTVTPISAGSVTIDLPEGCVIDADGNTNGAAPQLAVTNINSSTPTVTLSTPSSSVSGSFAVTATFSEDVTGVSASDFVITNGSASGLSGGPSTYTVTVSPDSIGSVTVDFPAGAAEDGESNGNAASNTLNVTYSIPSAPSVSLSGPATATSAYTINVVFDEAVTGLIESDFSVTNGTASSLTGSGSTYSLLVTPSTPGSVSVSLPANSVVDLNDALGNTASNTVTTVYSESNSGGGGTSDVSTHSPSAWETVDSNGGVPANGSNNVDKFTAGSDNSGVINPFTTNLYVRSSASNADRVVRGFVKWDLSSLAGQPVVSATLTFDGHSLNGSGTNSMDLEIVPLSADWIPGGSSPLPTYNHSTTGSPISGGSITSGLDSDHVREYTFDMTEIVRNWNSGTWANHGIRIQLSESAKNNGVGIKTADTGAIQIQVEIARLEVGEAFVVPGSDDFTISWNSAPGELYRIEANENLEGTWELIGNVPGAVDSGTTSYTITDGMTGHSSRFFRVSYPASP